VGGLEVLIPRQADSFVNSVGVTFGVNNEYEVGIAREALLELRVRHVRGFAQALPDLEFRLTAELAGEELRLLLVVDPRLDVSGKDIPRLVSAHPTLESIEGPNDFDAYGIDLTSEQVSAAMVDLRSGVDVASRKLFLVDAQDSLRAGVGDLSQLLDYGNFERFRNTDLPGDALDNEKASARSVCGSRPLFVTECGYSTLAGHARSVSEEAAARYLPRLLLSHFAQGIERTYLDDLREGRAPSGPTSAQGLIRYDGRRKPAFFALKHLLGRVLDAGAAFETTPFEVAISTSADTLRTVLLQRRDGTTLLLLWNEVASFDASLGGTLTPEPIAVTVELPAATPYALFRPLLGEAATEEGLSQRIELAVPDDVLILELSR